MKQRGFTLLEILIALSIFAIMAVIAYNGLNQVLENSQAVEIKSERLTRLQQMFVRLEQDITQRVNRSVRDEFGDTREAMLGNDIYLLELTRRGWHNPTEQPRAGLQRVAWRIKEGELVREYWSTLDRGDERPPRTQVYFKEEAEPSMLIRFMNDDELWVEDWPPVSDGTTGNPFPRAIEVTIELDGLGEIRRLYRVEG